MKTQIVTLTRGGTTHYKAQSKNRLGTWRDITIEFDSGGHAVYTTMSKEKAREVINRHLKKEEDWVITYEDYPV